MKTPTPYEVCLVNCEKLKKQVKELEGENRELKSAINWHWSLHITAFVIAMLIFLNITRWDGFLKIQETQQDKSWMLIDKVTQLDSLFDYRCHISAFEKAWNHNKDEARKMILKDFEDRMKINVE